jgi:hypothetical protein
MKFIIALAGLIAAVVVGAGFALATGGGSSDPPAPGRVDISGPCDEAENLNDARCAGVEVPRTGGATRAPAAGVDVSGPCDEAEHANDPRCIPGLQLPEDVGEDAVEAPRDDDDNRGHSGSSGPGHDGDDDDRDGDDNSGPGSGDDRDDNSGPGEGDDRDDDDRDDDSGHSSDDD